MVIHRPGVGAELIVSAKLLHHDIMGVDMRAGRNPALSKSDDLAVSPYRCTIGDLSNGDFVSSANVVERPKLCGAIDKFVARFYGTFQHGDVIIVAKQNGEISEAFCTHSHEGKSR